MLRLLPALGLQCAISEGSTVPLLVPSLRLCRATSQHCAFAVPSLRLRCASSQHCAFAAPSVKAKLRHLTTPRVSTVARRRLPAESLSFLYHSQVLLFLTICKSFFSLPFASPFFPYIRKFFLSLHSQVLPCLTIRKSLIALPLAIISQT